MKISASDPRTALHRDAAADSAFVEADASLAGSVNFRSHLQSGHRVATEYTIRPKETHLGLMQALIHDLAECRVAIRS